MRYGNLIAGKHSEHPLLELTSSWPLKVYAKP